MSSAFVPSHHQQITVDNAPQMREVARFGRGTISQIAWAHDGNILAVAGSLGVWLYDAHNLNAEPRLLAHPTPVQTLAVSADGKTLATGDRVRSRLPNPASILLCDVESGQERLQLRGHTEAITCLDFSPDSKLLASGSLDNTVRLWDTETGMDRGTLWLENSFITDVAFGAGGTLLASTDFHGRIDIWDVRTGKLVRRIQHQHDLWSIAFSSHGKILVTSNMAQNGISLWDIDLGTEIRRFDHKAYRQPTSGFPLHSDSTEARFSPDGTKLVSAACMQTNGLQVFDVESGAPLDGFCVPGPIRSVAFSPDGNRLAAASSMGITLWDMNTGKTYAHCEHSEVIHKVALSPRGDALAYVQHHRVSLLSLSTQTVLWQQSLELSEEYWLLWERFIGSSHQIQFTPDGDTLLVLPADGTGLRLLDMATGIERSRLETFNGKRLNSHRATISADGKIIVTASLEEGSASTLDSTLGHHDKPYFWNAETLEVISSTDVGDLRVSDLALSPDKSRLATGGAGLPYEVGVYDVATGQRIHTFKDHHSEVHDLIFTPDGSHLISVSHYSLLMWDIAAGTLARSFIDHKPVKITVEYPEGMNGSHTTLSIHKLLANVEHGSSIFWSTASNPPADISLVHEAESRIQTIALSPNGALLAAGFEDGNIQVFDVATGSSLLLLEGHTLQVTGLGFTPDNTLLISGSHDGTICYWGIA